MHNFRLHFPSWLLFASLFAFGLPVSAVALSGSRPDAAAWVRIHAVVDDSYAGGDNIIQRISACTSIVDDFYNYGQSLAVSGNFLAIGAPSGPGVNGNVFLFGHNVVGNGYWGLIKILVASDSPAGDKFRPSIPIDSATRRDAALAVGTPAAGNILAARTSRAACSNSNPSARAPNRCVQNCLSISRPNQARIRHTHRFLSTCCAPLRMLAAIS